MRMNANEGLAKGFRLWEVMIGACTLWWRIKHCYG